MMRNEDGSRRRALRAPDGAAEARDEIAAHLAMREEELIAAGWSPDSARREAIRRFGDVERARERFERSARRRSSRARRQAMRDAVADSLRQALRQIRRSPGFAAAVIVSLGVAVGANAAMFRLVDRLMLRPPAHLHAPDRVSRLLFDFHYATGREASTTISGYERFEDIATASRSFDAVVATAVNELTVGTGEEALSRPVMLASGAFWSLFDAKPVLGRFFGPGEDELPSGSPVAVLSWLEWRSRSGASLYMTGSKTWIFQMTLNCLI
jgi:hypothetical protein